MIIGIGTDIVQIQRIEKLLEKYNDMFLERTLTNQEIEKYYSLDKKLRLNFLAKRYAAKEAIAKAFGTGIGKEIGFQDINIQNDSKGKPEAIVSSSISEGKKVDISMSDDYPIAVAFAVVSQ